MIENLTDEQVKFFMKKYNAKISSTKKRIDKNANPIEFRLSFEEYVSLYLDKGVLPSRQYVLARHEDIGHYEIGNVSVIHHVENLCDAHGKTSDLDKKITQFCIENNYLRRIVRYMIKRGKLSL